MHDLAQATAVNTALALGSVCALSLVLRAVFQLRVIGLTGGIGSGKSSFVKELHAASLQTRTSCLPSRLVIIDLVSEPWSATRLWFVLSCRLSYTSSIFKVVRR